MRFVGRFGNVTTDEDGNRKYVDYMYTLESEELDAIIEKAKTGDIDAEEEALNHIRDCDQVERYLDYVSYCADKGNKAAQGLISWRKECLRKEQTEKILQLSLVLVVIATIAALVKWIFF